MNNVPTPHIKATEGQIAKTVLMPGDPLRAKFIAETYLSDYFCFNEVRNMLGYTGFYKGKQISVMGSGMGLSSIGLYTYELYHFYDVDNIIRIGTAGGLAEQVKPRDVVIAMTASTDANYADQYRLPGSFAPCASFPLLRHAVDKAEALGITIQVGNILSTGSYYFDDPTANEAWKRMGILAIEMETAALYMNAARANKNALGIFTISNNISTGEELSPMERQTGFTKMMEIALETALSFS